MLFWADWSCVSRQASFAESDREVVKCRGEFPGVVDGVLAAERAGVLGVLTGEPAGVIDGLLVRDRIGVLSDDLVG